MRWKSPPRAARTIPNPGICRGAANAGKCGFTPDGEEGESVVPAPLRGGLRFSALTGINTVIPPKAGIHFYDFCFCFRI